MLQGEIVVITGPWHLLRYYFFCIFAMAAVPLHAQDAPARIAVVSSYHPEMVWVQEVHKGRCAALLESGYLNADEIATYSKTDRVEGNKCVIQKWWMDTKRLNERRQIADSLVRIVAAIDTFKPDVILLGDDNAANYIGNHYLDTGIPVVFCGVNGLPIKYGLVETIDRPGHNVTGIYQTGYHADAIRVLKQLDPEIKRLALLSDDSPTGRAILKSFRNAVRKSNSDLKIVATIQTNSYSKLQRMVKEVSVDAFFLGTLFTLKDDDDKPVSDDEAYQWYVTNIKVAEIATNRDAVNAGGLFCVEDAGSNQGRESVNVAARILRGESPASIGCYTPGPGPVIFNNARLTNLGITADPKSFAANVEFLRPSDL